MDALPLEKRGLLGLLSRSSDLLLAAGILAVLLVILVPLPPALMDLLLLVNLAGSAVILLTAAYAVRPLDFSSFPSILLIATFLRLALNIASTRLILGDAGDHGMSAAGGVIEAFSLFVAGRNLAAGLIVFLILVVVQFVVITKGTTRVSEVAARFTLDAMPGKQLSIDGDLAAGAITDEEARRRRRNLQEEASFFGAMDGASKFVRGEAVAGIFIVLTNVLGGFFLGTVYHGLDVARAAGLFTRLSVGDGLVTQVPALMVSVATALLVTRSSGTEGLGQQIGRQLLSSDRVLYAAAAFLVILLPSGLPKLGLLAGAAVFITTGYLVSRRKLAVKEAAGEEAAETPARRGHEAPDAQARALLVLEPIELELGIRLVSVVDEARGGDLMSLLSKARDRIAMELGLVVPPIKVVDNTRLHPAEYSIKLRANGVGRWRVKPGKYFVSSDPAALDGFPGSPGIDPGTGARGLWIDENLCPQAASAGLGLRKVSELVADHLERVTRIHAAEMLTREEVARLINDLRRRAPALVDELIPGTLKLGEVQKVLQALLREQVSIRDLEAILETLADHGDRTRDPRELTEFARHTLSRTICSSVAGRDGLLRAALLDPALEEFLQRSVEKAERGTRLAIEPEMAEALVDSVVRVMESFGEHNAPAVLVCSGMIRAHLKELTCGRAPLLTVLAYDEITDDFRLETLATVTLEQGALGGIRSRTGGRVRP